MGGGKGRRGKERGGVRDSQRIGSRKRDEEEEGGKEREEKMR